MEHPPGLTESNRSHNDTIVAVSTPPGRGGIGIVRLSGPDAVRIALSLVILRNPLSHALVRFAEVADPISTNPQSGKKERLDEALVTWFAAPNSYTGEDLVEIAAHGSPVILDVIVRQAIIGGARLADPGEFTQRAFLSNRIDLTQAEAVRDLIDAQTLYQARVAAQQLSGALSRRICPIKDDLVKLIATLEAGIDFAEDDVDVIGDEEILQHISSVRIPLSIIGASFRQGRIVHSGFSMAIVGLPNAGKSSLFNRIAERERAIVTANPGTTRDLVTEHVSIEGIPFQLIDTAGLREASDEAESIGIQKTREALADADLILLVVDASGARKSEETELFDLIAGRPALIAWNKCDLVEESEIPATVVSRTTVRTSAKTGEGIDALRRQILAAIGAGGELQSGLLTNLRQHNSVSDALRALDAAESAVTNHTPHEMLLLDLYGALRQLDALTGETTSDDILNLVFSTFCIGK
jgi:tRNA modification GTPase